MHRVQRPVRRRGGSADSSISDVSANEDRGVVGSAEALNSNANNTNAAATHPRRRFFYRTLEPPDREETIFSSQELELLSALDMVDPSRTESLYLPRNQEDDNDDDDCSSGSSDDSSGSSLSTIAELQREQQEAVLLQRTQEGKRLSVLTSVVGVRPQQQRHGQQQSAAPNDLQLYMAKRHMTSTQERWNALTMIPSPMYCIYFLLSACWLSTLTVAQHQQLQEEAARDVDNNLDYYYYSNNDPSQQQPAPSFLNFANHVFGDEMGCLSPSSWHNMPALPPIAVVAVAFGICAHAPFSFLYHWTFAHSLPAGTARTTHWSRRMDQSMIHFASAFMSYGTSGSWDFFVANVLFNAECIYCQFKRKVRPRRNKIRIGISIIAYTIPILRRGDLELFFKAWAVIALSGWFFIVYPIGGWSHAAFHVLISFLPPLLMRAATELPVSQEQLRLAAMCAALQQQQQL